MSSPREILDFWFTELDSEQWFKPDQVLDARIRRCFGNLCQQALDGGLSAWEEAANSTLALTLMLDQFPRNIWRNDARAFAGDEVALPLAERAVNSGWLDNMAAERCQFMLMPFMHSEDLDAQRRGLKFFSRYCSVETTDFSRRHLEIIERFGRFPHRNQVLGRSSSEEELAFLRQPGSSF